MAQVWGFAGKLGMDGSKVWDAFLAGDIGGIRDYCETDVLNTYLVFMRFQLLRGVVNKAGYDAEMKVVRDFLAANAGAEHWQKFAGEWK